MKCFFHRADFDGQCSGAIVKYLHPETELIPINYDEELPWESIKPGEIVFMVDFTLEPVEDFIRLSKMCHLIWIDHHVSSIEVGNKNGLSKLAGCRQVGVAACILTWQYLFPEKKLPRGIELLGRYDVWDHKDPETLPYQYGLKLEDTDPNNQALWKSIFEEEKTFHDKTLHYGKVVWSYQQNENLKTAKAYSFEMKFEGYRALALNGNDKGSNLFDGVIDKDKHDIMLVFNYISPIWNFSIYTAKPNIDVSKIAAKYDGGGHAQASGFKCKELPFSLT